MLSYSKVFKYERITRCPTVLPHNENRRQQAVLIPAVPLPPPVSCCSSCIAVETLCLSHIQGMAVPCLRRSMAVSHIGGPGLISGQSFWIKVGHVSPREFRVYINITVPLMLYIRSFIYPFINPSVHLFIHHRHRFSSCRKKTTNTLQTETVDVICAKTNTSIFRA
jgi:hypothetical protein